MFPTASPPSNKEEWTVPTVTEEREKIVEQGWTVRRIRAIALAGEKAQLCSEDEKRRLYTLPQCFEQHAFQHFRETSRKRASPDNWHDCCENNICTRVASVRIFAALPPMSILAIHVSDLIMSSEVVTQGVHACLFLPSSSTTESTRSILTSWTRQCNGICEFGLAFVSLPFLLSLPPRLPPSAFLLRCYRCVNGGNIECILNHCLRPLLSVAILRTKRCDERTMEYTPWT
jgi:hypothetical protein